MQAILRAAMAAHRKDDLDAAENGYRAMLAERPDDPDALHYLGVLLHQRGCGDEAVALVEKALKANPDNPGALNNLGNIHKELEHLDAADACYRRALELAPGMVEVWSNLATVMEARDRLPEAFQCLVRYLHGAPRQSRAHFLMGMFLRDHPQSMQHIEQAAECFREALRLEPDALDAMEKLGVTLYALDRHEEARQVYVGWLRREPDNPVPRHMLAACGGSDAPARASDAYVCAEFDSFAESFDRQLVEHLHYRAPQVLVAALAEVLPAPDAGLDILDAGCGTGLCAPLLKPHARRLVGVDLSSGMLARARRRGGYDALFEAELTAYLRAHANEHDVVLSADTLVYFGDLGEVLEAAHASLRPGGWVAFSLEAMEGEGCRLSPSGRYQHSRQHVLEALHAAGFARPRIQADSLRREAGKDVASWVVRAQRPATEKSRRGKRSDPS